MAQGKWGNKNMHAQKKKKKAPANVFLFQQCDHILAGTRNLEEEVQSDYRGEHESLKKVLKVLANVSKNEL